MEENNRKEILEFLAQGKITIDEAVQMLSLQNDAAEINDEPVHKVDISTEKESNDLPALETDFNLVDAGNQEIGLKSPNWLRIKVSNLESGKNKVSVNIPFGLIEFGMGIASVFSPNDDIQFGNFKDMIARAEPGLLLDVEDDDSNEHVQIYFD